MLKPLRTDSEYNEYVKDFYRKVEDYDWNDITDNVKGLESFFHRYREKQVMKLINKYKYRSNGKCLDVGCGTGLLLRHLPEGAVGVDLNPRHIKRAAKYVPAAELSVGDVEALDFPDKTFSTVICTEVLEHLVYPEKALAEIKRVLKPEGVIIGSTPRRALLWRFRWLSSTHYHNEPFHNEFTDKELRELLSDWKIKFLKKGILGSIFFFVLQPN